MLSAVSPSLNVARPLFPRGIIKNAAFDQGEGRTARRVVVRGGSSKKSREIA